MWSGLLLLKGPHPDAVLIVLQSLMPPASTSAPGTAPYTGADNTGAGDAQGMSGEGIGLETDQPITGDQAPSPSGVTNPYLDMNRIGSGPPANSSVLPIVTPGGE